MKLPVDFVLVRHLLRHSRAGIARFGGKFYMRRLLLSILFLAAVSLPAFADSITVTGSYFMPRGDSDIFTQNEHETSFRTNDLNGLGAQFRYDHFLGNYINIGGGVSFYDQNTDVVDNDFEFPNGNQIVRNIELQIVPLEVNLHILPAGRDVPVIPYIGGGAGLYFWEYHERGDFVLDRLTNPHVFPNGRADSSGTDGGWHVEGGVQIPFSRAITATGEFKYFRAHGDLDPRSFDTGFQPIDLSSSIISGGISFWF
jgi:opacity protein-like surface antigen